jgi:hypothetical protein
MFRIGDRVKLCVPPEEVKWGFPGALGYGSSGYADSNQIMVVTDCMPYEGTIKFVVDFCTERLPTHWDVDYRDIELALEPTHYILLSSGVIEYNTLESAKLKATEFSQNHRGQKVGIYALVGYVTGGQ